MVTQRGIPHEYQRCLEYNKNTDFYKIRYRNISSKKNQGTIIPFTIHVFFRVLLVFRGSPVNLAVQVRRVNRELSVVVVRGDKGETEERLEGMGWMDQLGLLGLQEGVENQEQRESG